MSTAGTRDEHRIEWSVPLQDAIDGTLDGSAQRELDAHVAGCSACRGEIEFLRGIDSALRSRFTPPTLDGQFDRRVLEGVREIDTAQLAAKRARAEQQYARWSAALARNWRGARHMLVANLVALSAAAIALGIAVTAAFAAPLSRFADSYVAMMAAAPQRPALMLAIAAAAAVLGLAVSTRVKP